MVHSASAASLISVIDVRHGSLFPAFITPCLFLLPLPLASSPASTTASHAPIHKVLALPRCYVLCSDASDKSSSFRMYACHGRLWNQWLEKLQCRLTSLNSTFDKGNYIQTVFYVVGKFTVFPPCLIMVHWLGREKKMVNVS